MKSYGYIINAFFDSGKFESKKAELNTKKEKKGFCLKPQAKRSSDPWSPLAPPKAGKLLIF